MSSEQASEIQRRIYDFIVNYIRQEGMPPTNREIGQAMKIASTGHVDYHLSMLEKKNYILRESKKSRGIKLVQRPPAGIPIVGRIAAGRPIENYAEPDQMLDVDHDVAQQNTYALEVKGNSMIEDHICDGDYVVIKPQSSCQNGDIVVAVHFLEENKSSATLKRFFLEQGQVRLQPANSEMEPIYISKREWDTEWQVQGKVVAIFRQYRAA
ncbi:MAG TPA: transcriptional repressor LexA [Ktedonobacteraceae bacterium]|nr:transcriptional repressor LexA [Ktedonobacteraceae bacterium]